MIFQIFLVLNGLAIFVTRIQAQPRNFNNTSSEESSQYSVSKRNGLQSPQNSDMASNDYHYNNYKLPKNINQQALTHSFSSYDGPNFRNYGSSGYGFSRNVPQKYLSYEQHGLPSYQQHQNIGYEQSSFDHPRNLGHGYESPNYDQQYNLGYNKPLYSHQAYSGYNKPNYGHRVNYDRRPMGYGPPINEQKRYFGYPQKHGYSGEFYKQALNYGERYQPIEYVIAKPTSNEQNPDQYNNGYKQGANKNGINYFAPNIYAKPNFDYNQQNMQSGFQGGDHSEEKQNDGY